MVFFDTRVSGQNDKAGKRALKSFGLLLGLAGITLASACAEKEVVLTGERENVRAVTEDGIATNALASSEASGTVPPLSIPAARTNAEWTQGISSPITRVEHPALSAAPKLAWTVNIGDGDGRRGRITADPVVGGGLVFTLDSKAQVSAVSPGGKVAWTRDLTPDNDSGKDSSGGGLAYGNGRIFVASGFGRLTALDAATGQEIWQQNMRATGTGSPAYSDGLVYVVSGDELAWALDADTGRIRWQLSATPDLHNVMGAPAPAITDKYVIFAFGSGELQGAFRQGGLRRWDAQIAGNREGFSSGRVEDITGDPVVQGDKIFVGSHAGRAVALNLGSGERIWTAPDGSLNPMWPVGDSVFMVTDRNELVRLSAETGDRIWGRTLPFFTQKKPRRQSEIFAHHGPIIAGGRLIIASSDGKLRLFDPTNGNPLGAVDFPGGATSNPVVAGNTLYLVTTKGQLLAFR